MPIAVIISILSLFLLWAHRHKFPAIFQPWPPDFLCPKRSNSDNLANLLM
jgi:hypothetical protein